MRRIRFGLPMRLGFRSLPGSIAMLLAIFALVASYLVGAIPFGWLIARAHGIDLFHAGSGNIGATNVGRVLGRKWGLIVFALDFAKGAMPVALGRLLPNEAQEAFDLP